MDQEQSAEAAAPERIAASRACSTSYRRSVMAATDADPAFDPLEKHTARNVACRFQRQE
ncbi:MAG: hypothetical protein ACYTG3_21180 [Planctomycetota bacterium]|jgi:hypothetical protein